jgi:hypothetical protein
MKASWCTVLMILQLITLRAQLPKTDVYLVDFDRFTGQPAVLSVKYLNNFNPNGYNNQAKFINKDELYLTVALDSHQVTEIYHLDIQQQHFYKFTQTKSISEFSPILHPDQKRLTVVRIESDGQDQSLWSYLIDRTNAGYRLFPELKNVGYYTWMDDVQVALFLVGSPHILALGNIKSGKVEKIIDNVGRCIKVNSKGNLYFVHKINEDFWALKEYNIFDKSITNICQMPSGREDFDMVGQGKILTTDGSQLKLYDFEGDKKWNIIADFSHLGLKNMNRPSVFNNRVVFINNK